MEGSGLKSVIEGVYAPLAVNHMLCDKAYARDRRGHIPISSALITLCLEYFIVNLTDDDLQEFESVYKSPDPKEKHNEAAAKKKLL